MSDEDDLPEETELPDWESLPDVPIPPTLDKKWRENEKAGLRAGVCSSCGFPFTEEQLSCAHCGAAIELPGGVFPALKHWFLKHPFGIIVSCLIFAALALALFLI